MLIQIIAATILAPSVAEIAKIFKTVAEIAKIFGSVAETSKGLLILSQPEVLARDSLSLAHAAGYDSAIAYWQFHKINEPFKRHSCAQRTRS